MAEAAEDTLVLVTGAAGFIGTHIVKQLQEAGYKVRGSVRSLANEGKVAAIRELCPDAKHPVEMVEADLSKEECWATTVKDCKYVIHVASSTPLDKPKDEVDILKPVVDGMMYVLHACAKSGGVKRLVITSSLAAISGDSIGGNHIYTEEDWTDTKKPISAYTKGETLAEHAAWDYVNALPQEEKFELTTLNPGCVLGPMLCGGCPPTAIIVKMIMERQMPLLFRISFNCINVQDVALAHIQAMTSPEAAGNRHILAHTPLWWTEMGSILAAEFKSQGYNPPSNAAPNFLVRAGAFFSSRFRGAASRLGVCTKIDASRMRDVLGITSPINVESSLIDMAYSMIEKGFVKKTPEYRGKTPLAKEATEAENETPISITPQVGDSNEQSNSPDSPVELSNEQSDSPVSPAKPSNEQSGSLDPPVEPSNEHSDSPDPPVKASKEQSDSQDPQVVPSNEQSDSSNPPVETSDQQPDSSDPPVETSNQQSDSSDPPVVSSNDQSNLPAHDS